MKTFPLKKSSSYLSAHFNLLARALFLANAARRRRLNLTAGVKSSMMLIPFCRNFSTTAGSRLACKTLTFVRTLGNLTRTGLEAGAVSPVSKN
jgi:hypothetical protein